MAPVVLLKTSLICYQLMLIIFACLRFNTVNSINIKLTFKLNVFVSCRYQHYSTTHTPQNSERQRERQRGLVKQTFELDEAAASERQDDQVADCDVLRIYVFNLLTGTDPPAGRCDVFLL